MFDVDMPHYVRVGHGDHVANSVTSREPSYLPCFQALSRENSSGSIVSEEDGCIMLDQKKLNIIYGESPTVSKKSRFIFTAILVTIAAVAVIAALALGGVVAIPAFALILGGIYAISSGAISAYYAKKEYEDAKLLEKDKVKMDSYWVETFTRHASEKQLKALIREVDDPSFLEDFPELLDNYFKVSFKENLHRKEIFDFVNEVMGNPLLYSEEVCRLVNNHHIDAIEAYKSYLVETYDTVPTSRSDSVAAILWIAKTLEHESLHARLENVDTKNYLLVNQGWLNNMFKNAPWAIERIQKTIDGIDLVSTRAEAAARRADDTMSNDLVYLRSRRA